MSTFHLASRLPYRSIWNQSDWLKFYSLRFFCHTVFSFLSLGRNIGKVVGLQFLMIISKIIYLLLMARIFRDLTVKLIRICATKEIKIKNQSIAKISSAKFRKKTTWIFSFFTTSLSLFRSSLNLKREINNFISNTLFQWTRTKIKVVFGPLNS